MIHERRIADFLGLAQARRVAWVLGAGASVPHVIQSARLGAVLSTAIEVEVGSFPVERIPAGPLRGVLSREGRSWKDWLVREETLRLLTAKHLRSTNGGRAVPERTVFSLFPSTHVLLDYNTDGLSSVCGQRVVPVHGTIPACLPYDDPGEWGEWVDICQDGIDLSPLSFWYPVPEHPRFASSREAQLIRKILEWADAVIFVGYSFGGLPGDELLDGVSYELFSSQLRDRETPVLIVDPAAVEIAGVLAEAWRSPRVLPLSARWDRLSHAMHRISSSDRVTKNAGLLGRELRLLREYDGR